MRMLFMGLTGFCFVLFGCSRSGVPKQQFPAHITGTVASLDISFLDIDPVIPNGIVEIDASDGKSYHFKFAKVQDIYPDNCSMHLDTTLILPQNTPYSDTSTEALQFIGCYRPNAIDIRFFDSASTDDTRGVKDVHATFTADTKIWGGFFNYDNRANYVSDRIKTINKINAIVRGIKDINPTAPGDQPARIICQAYTY